MTGNIVMGMTDDSTLRSAMDSNLQVLTFCSKYS